METSELPRTSEGLREALFHEIDLFRKGKGNRGRALSISEMAKQITQSFWTDGKVGSQS